MCACLKKFKWTVLSFKHALIYLRLYVIIKNNIKMVMDLLKSNYYKTLFLSVEHVFYEHLLSPYDNKPVIKNKTLHFIRFKTCRSNCSKLFLEVLKLNTFSFFCQHRRKVKNTRPTYFIHVRFFKARQINFMSLR